MDINKITEKLAIRKVELEGKIKSVKQTAMEANPIIYQELLQNVAQGIPYEYLNVPYSRSHSYRIRNLFFNLLDEKVT